MTQPTTDTAPRRQVLKIRAGRLSFALSLQEFFGNTEPYKRTWHFFILLFTLQKVIGNYPVPGHALCHPPSLLPAIA